MATATLTSGLNEITTELAVGKTIREIRTSLATPLNIAPGAVASANGETVNDNYVVQEDDDIEFVKPAGQKGR